LTLVNDIKNSYNNGKLIPFIGSGFTTNIDNYPQWRDFIAILEKNLKNDCHIDVNLFYIFKNNYLEATEFYVWSYGEYKVKSGYSATNDHFTEGKRALLALLRNLFSSQAYNKIKWTTHDILLSKFKDTTIYTTNWDDTLEKAKGNNLSPIYKLANFRTVTKTPFIIKFHGHYEDPTSESLIACETDYLKRISEENPFDIKFKNDLLHNNFLFIGYSFNDPNIKLILYGFNEMLSKFKVYTDHKPEIFWLSTEFSDDRRVETLSASSKGIIKPLFLLDNTQQNELKDIEKDLLSNCSSCTFYWSCDNKTCSKYNNRENFKDDYSTKKSKYLKEKLIELLDGL
jgi:hypothetical protein